MSQAVVVGFDDVSNQAAKDHSVHQQTSPERKERLSLFVFISVNTSLVFARLHVCCVESFVRLKLRYQKGLLSLTAQRAACET